MCGDPTVISNTGNTTHQSGTMVNDEEPSLALAPPSVIVSNNPGLHALFFVTDDETTRLTPVVAPVLASPTLALPALPELNLVRLTRSNPPSPLVMTMRVIPHFVSHLRLLYQRA